MVSVTEKVKTLLFSPLQPRNPGPKALEGPAQGPKALEAPPSNPFYQARKPHLKVEAAGNPGSRPVTLIDFLSKNDTCFGLLHD